MNIFLRKGGVHERLIRDFVRDVGSDFCQVRGVKLADELGCRQLRTRKNRFLAVKWDELGNAFALTQSGIRKQVLRDEYKGA